MEEFFSDSTQWISQVFQSITDNTELTRLLTVVAILIITGLVAHWGTKLIRRVVDKISSDFSSASILINILRVVIWAIGISVILANCFGVDVTALVTALGVGGIALSLGLQDTISNLIGGLQLSLMKVIKPGDYVTAGGVTGIVTDVAWRHVKIQDFSGNHYVIPNSTINNSTLTVRPPARKILVPIYFIHNGTDINWLCDQMAKAVESALQPYGTVMEKPVVLLTGITEFGIGATIIVWMKSNENVQTNMSVIKDVIIRAAIPYARATDAEHVPHVAPDVTDEYRLKPKKVAEIAEEDENFGDWMSDWLDKARTARQEIIEEQKEKFQQRRRSRAEKKQNCGKKDSEKENPAR